MAQPWRQARTQQAAIQLAEKQLSEGAGGTLEVYTGTGAFKARTIVRPVTAAPKKSSGIVSFVKKPFVWVIGVALVAMGAVLNDEVFQPLF